MEEVTIIEYKKLIRSKNNQYDLKVPSLIMEHLDYDRFTDCFKMTLKDGKLIIEFVKGKQNVVEEGR